MAVLVQTGGKIKITPTDYEQLINYTMLYDEGKTIDNATVSSVNVGISGVSLTINEDNVAYSLTGALNSAKIAGLKIAKTINYSEYSTCNVLSNNSEATGAGSASDSSSSWQSGFALLSTASYHDVITSKYAVANIGKSVTRIDVNDITDSYDFILAVSTNNKTSPYKFVGSISGIFLAKPDDITTLCTKAGISAPTSLDTLLADTTSLTAIFNNEDAVKFMVKQCTGDFMIGVLNSADVVALLKASPYLNTVVGNPHWAKFIMMIPTAKELLGYTMLYDNGIENLAWSTVTSGGYFGGAVTKESDHIAVTPVTTVYKDRSAIYTSNKIESEEYSKAHFKASVSNSIASDEGTAFQLLSSISISTSSLGTLLTQDYTYGATGDILFSLDITGYSNYYVAMRVHKQPTDFYNMFLTKADDLATWAWASLGGVTATDLDTLLADSTKMATLMANEEACKYLMGCTGDLMISICNSETAMSALVNNIAYDYAFNHPVWYKFMTTIPTSLAAMDSVAVTVPTMTSNTTPSGEAFADSVANTTAYPIWKAFNGDASSANYWISALKSGEHYIGYKFTSPIKLYRFKLVNGWATSYTEGMKTCKLQGSNDGNTWVDLTPQMVLLNPKSETWQEFVIDYSMLGEYSQYRLLGLGDSYYSDGRNAINEIQFYGKAVTK